MSNSRNDTYAEHALETQDVGYREEKKTKKKKSMFSFYICNMIKVLSALVFPPHSSCIIYIYMYAFVVAAVALASLFFQFKRIG